MKPKAPQCPPSSKLSQMANEGRLDELQPHLNDCLACQKQLRSWKRLKEASQATPWARPHQLQAQAIENKLLAQTYSSPPPQPPVYKDLRWWGAGALAAGSFGLAMILWVPQGQKDIITEPSIASAKISTEAPQTKQWTAPYLEKKQPSCSKSSQKTQKLPALAFSHTSLNSFRDFEQQSLIPQLGFEGASSQYQVQLGELARVHSLARKVALPQNEQLELPPAPTQPKAPKKYKHSAPKRKKAVKPVAQAPQETVEPPTPVVQKPQPSAQEAVEDTFVTAFSLYQQSNYSQAAIAFEKLANSAKNSTLAADINYWRAMSLLKSKQQAPAAQLFKRQLLKYGESMAAAKAALQLAQLSLAAGDQEEAAWALSFAKRDANPKIRHAAEKLWQQYLSTDETQKAPSP